MSDSKCRFSFWSWNCLDCDHSLIDRNIEWIISGLRSLSRDRVDGAVGRCCTSTGVLRLVSVVPIKHWGLGEREHDMSINLYLALWYSHLHIKTICRSVWARGSVVSEDCYGPNKYHLYTLGLSRSWARNYHQSQASHRINHYLVFSIKFSIKDTSHWKGQI